MAVYTQITEDALTEFLRGYDLGALESFKGIEQGVENTNYHLFTDQGRFILTLFEKRVNPGDLPFFFRWTDHLATKGVTCPLTLTDRRGEVIGTLAGRPAAVISFLEGRGVEPEEISPAICRQLGKMVARMHLAAADFPDHRTNSMGPAAWRDLFDKTESGADDLRPGLKNLIAHELDYLERSGQPNLPRGVVHADIFPDNVFISGDSVSGVIDFYFSCTEYFAYDLALVINAWCFDETGQFKGARLMALLEGYQSERMLSPEEMAQMQFMARRASLRILMTRLHDWIFHPPGAMVKPKDPLEYADRLSFHRTENLFSPALQVTGQVTGTE